VNPRSAIQRFALALAVTAPMAAYLALAWATRVDAPISDDFDALLGFLVRDREATAAPERLANLMAPHVDHRLVLSRLVALAAAFLQGRIDFSLLSGIGNLALLGLFAGLATQRLQREGDLGLYPLLAFSLLLFQPQGFDVVHWPTASIAGNGVLLLAWAAFAALARGGRAGIAAAWLCAFAALYTQGNGVAIFPAAALALCAAGRVRDAGAWTLASLPPLALYALTYQGRSLPSLSWLAHAPEIAHHFLNFLGAAPAFSASPWAALVGLALLGGVAGLTARRAARTDFTGYGLILFVLATAAGNAWLRADLGADYALDQPRYRVASILLVGLCHLGAWDALRNHPARRIYAVVAVLAAFSFSLASWNIHASDVRERSARAARSLARFTLTGVGPRLPDPSRTADLLARASELGIYRPDLEGLGRFLDRAVIVDAPRAATGGVELRLGRVAYDDALVLVEGWASARGADPARVRTYLLVDSGSARRVLTTTRAGPAAFRTLAPRSVAGAGRLGVLLVDRELAAVALSDQRIPELP
jgi:hypothetical protein